MANDQISIHAVNFDDLSKKELSLFFAVMTRMHHLRTTSVVFNFDELKWVVEDDEDFDTKLHEIFDNLRKTSATYDLGDGPAKHDFFTKVQPEETQRIVSIQLNADFEFLVQVDQEKWEEV